MKLAILGPPGSGKTTQAEILARLYHLRHIYMGELLREEAESDSPVADRIRDSLERGELVSEDIVIAILAREIADVADDYILDGVPRTMAQALALEMMLSEKGESLDAVVSLEVAPEEIIRRLTARGRPDDKPDLILRRIRVFHEETDPVIRIYHDKAILLDVCGNGPQEAVADVILHSLHNRLSSRAA